MKRVVCNVLKTYVDDYVSLFESDTDDEEQKEHDLLMIKEMAFDKLIHEFGYEMFYEGTEFHYRKKETV